MGGLLISGVRRGARGALALPEAAQATVPISNFDVGNAQLGLLVI